MRPRRTLVEWWDSVSRRAAILGCLFSVIGLGVFLVLLLIGYLFWCSRTFYAEGFSEAKFATLREGMTTSQVETIMGPPLERVERSGGEVLWLYSDRPDVSCSFEMRSVFFRDDKVFNIVKMEWTE